MKGINSMSKINKNKLEKEINVLCDIAIDRLENNVKRVDTENVSEEVWELAKLSNY